MLMSLDGLLGTACLVASTPGGCEAPIEVSLACLKLVIVHELMWLVTRVREVLTILLDHHVLHLHQLFWREKHLLLLRALSAAIGQNK